MSRATDAEIVCPMRTQPSAVAPVPAETTAPSTAYIWWTMTSIVLGGYISVLNSHVINVVIPKMMSSLGTDVLTIRWAVTAYMLSNAVVIPLVGWLGRVLGTRDLYIYSLIVFTGGAVMCGMANSVTMLILFRIIQGLGGHGLYTDLAQTAGKPSHSVFTALDQEDIRMLRHIRLLAPAGWRPSRRSSFCPQSPRNGWHWPSQWVIAQVRRSNSACAAARFMKNLAPHGLSLWSMYQTM